MDLNLDWMTLDDFQKHLNGEDEILSGPPLSPSEFKFMRYTLSKWLLVNQYFERAGLKLDLYSP